MTPTTPVGLHRALDAIWRAPRGIAALSAVNHSVVGRRFIITAFIYFAIGGVLAMLIRAQLARPENPFLGADAYNQIFTMHGTVMMFLFAIPLIEGVALYLLPKILGARDLAYPRLSAFGYWCYLFGGTIILVAIGDGRCPRQRLVHVHAARIQHLYARHQCRCLAAGYHLRGDFRRLRSGGDRRHSAQSAHRWHGAFTHAADGVVSAGNRRDDADRLPAADSGQCAAGDGAGLQLALLRP